MWCRGLEVGVSGFVVVVDVLAWCEWLSGDSEGSYSVGEGGAGS